MIHLNKTEEIAVVKASNEAEAGHLLNEYLESNYCKIIHVGCTSESNGNYTFKLRNKISDEDISSELNKLKIQFNSGEIDLDKLLKETFKFGRRVGDLKGRLHD